MKILFVCFIWPEPTSSAAGIRTLQLIEAFKARGHSVRAFSPCQPNRFKDHLDEIGVKTESVPPNDPRFDQLVKEFSPDVVIFDRFMIEEQFSWRVREQAPEALRVLDTIDLHSLRRARERKVESTQDLLHLTDAELLSEDTLRELAAIYRSDLSFLVSDFEAELLQTRLRVPKELLRVCRYVCEPLAEIPSFESRRHFVSIGNFNHAPNRDAVRVLHRQIWPKLQQQFKDAELHVYGAYPTEEFLKLDDSASGFRVKGHAPDARTTLSAYRVNLAPLRFGAGIKGKILDGFCAGTPCVTTHIGAEGLTDGLEFGGTISSDWEKFVIDARSLYADKLLWSKAQALGLKIIAEVYNAEVTTANSIESIQQALSVKDSARLKNATGAMLWREQMRSTEFFSRWIEAKTNRTSCDRPWNEEAKKQKRRLG